LRTIFGETEERQDQLTILNDRKIMSEYRGNS